MTDSVIDRAAPQAGPSATEDASSSTGESRRAGMFAKLRGFVQEHPRKAAFFAIALLAALVAGSYFVHEAFLYEDTDDAEIDGHIMPLSSRINGQVVEVRVIQGQLVHAGDILVVIDPKDYKVATDEARSALADAKATAQSLYWNVPVTSASATSNLDSAVTAVSNAEAGVDRANHNLEAARASLAQAEANAVKSDADLKRYTELVAKEDISRQQYDESVATAKANRAAVEAA
jgi:membrane fusion protein (multidrug efflux system)